MKVKNKTAHFQKCGGVRARPWRTIEVPEGSQVNENIFEILGEKKKPINRFNKTKFKIGDD